MSNTNEIKLLQEIRDTLQGQSGGGYGNSQELLPQLISVTSGGDIPAGAIHVSVNVISGTGTFGDDEYPISPNNTPLDFPYIQGKKYPEIPYTVSNGGELQILVVREAI